LHVLELGHELARALTRIDGELHRSDALAPCRAFLAQMLESLHTAFVARAARLDAFADPDFFLRPEFLEAPVREILGHVDLRLALLVDGVIARKGAQDPAIELRDAVRHL